MRVIADLHIHSKYSRATGASMELGELARSAKVKGISLLGTGDFTHPEWIAELKQKLMPSGNGLFEFDGIKFMLTAEVSNVFERKGIIKKVHSIIAAPSFEIAGQLNELLAKKASLSSDGRPTVNEDVVESLEKVLSVSKECAFIPAHAWTPWFSVFGSKSGFNSVEECFGDKAKEIFVLETGLSSDPAMNWRLSALDRYALISNSDSHSAQKIGREANVFEFREEFGYSDVFDAIRKKDRKQFLFTIEFFPEEGKYHFDGHRNCNVSFSPKESERIKNTCPVCRRKLTIGVMHRVEELADREEGFVLQGAVPFRHVVPLGEIAMIIFGKGSKGGAIYQQLVSKFGTEFGVLLDAEIREIEKVDEKAAKAVALVREGRVLVTPGYDGVYGKVSISGEKKKAQKTLESW